MNYHFKGKQFHENEPFNYLAQKRIHNISKRIGWRF